MKNAGRVLLNPARNLVAVQRLVFEHHQDGELRAAAFDRMTQRCHGVLYIGYLYIRCQGLWRRRSWSGCLRRAVGLLGNHRAFSTHLAAPTIGSNLPPMVGAVIYVRVSAKEETENLTKTTDRSQLQALLKYCRSHKGKVHFVVVNPRVGAASR